ncbi:hypothetical protein BH10BDE1_BH10BDE1_35750 [soil metagenome]
MKFSEDLIRSLAIHALVVAPFVVAIYFLPSVRSATERIPLQVFEIDSPRPDETATKNVNLSEPPKKTPKVVEPTKPVFGLSKDTLLDTSGASGVEVKAGNTIAKEPDNIAGSDFDSLPIPMDEFLVTSMPKLRKEVRAAYPEEARLKRIEGPVILDILIDVNGRVVDVKLVSGLGYGLDESAEIAMKQFEFAPALIEDRKVPVRVRYTYRFELR